MEFRHLFIDSDFAWKMRMRHGEPDFFTAGFGGQAVQSERMRWLDESPERYLAQTDEGAALIEDCIEIAANWSGATPSAEDLEGLGRFWEPDFILLDGESFRLAAGCVCLPSSWDLQESIGLTLDEIHHRVPDLNESIGASITKFLRRLPAGQIFYRESWSLTRTDDLNYHPALERQRLDASINERDIYLRIEHQAFVNLKHGVLMGIRIQPVELTSLADDRELLRGLRRQLESMPVPVAIYKGLDQGIPRAIEVLDQLLARPF